ncbi:hypothetical protein FQR65_LT13276 [Abscondita terminalis]|nr:hypothetical protein FQR65_LT13276 [Abscondita terminalis]
MAKQNIDINNHSLILHNQDVEESEELEERKRREEEVHSLLSHAMGQFNFGEQSTINSSITSNEGGNSIVDRGLSKEQLTALYDVKVRDVETLTLELDKLKEDFYEQQNKFRKQVTLLEAENRQKNMSLAESQNLLVEKAEQYMKLKEDMNELKTSIQSYDMKLKELQDENAVLREMNMGLEQQMVITQKGFPLLSSTEDKQFQESQRVKIQQLEHSLQLSQEETHRTNQQFKKLQEEMKRNICDRDNDILEKKMLIISLTNDNQHLQQQLLDGAKTIEELKSKLELTSNHLEEDLRKLQQKRQITEEIRENIWKEATMEFQPQITCLNMDNQKLREELALSKVMVNEVQRHIEQTRTLEIRNKDLENILEKLQNKYDENVVKLSTLSKKLKECEEERNELQEYQNQILADNQVLKALKIENENLQKEIVQLKVKSSNDERAIQTSLPFVTNAEVSCIQEKLQTAQGVINKLEEQVQILQDDNSKLQTKAKLEHEREFLIKELQKKATMFEKIIQQKKRQVEMISVGVNTTSQGDTSLLKVQHDTLQYQTEAKIHKKLKKEFDEKLLKAITEYSTFYKCKECKSLKAEVVVLNEMRQQDRDAVVKLIAVWENKFKQFEKDAEREILQLVSAKIKSDNTATEMKQILAEYTEKYKKIQQHLEKYNGKQFQSNNEIFVKNKENYDLLLKRICRITDKIYSCNRQMREAEQKFNEFDKESKN